MGASRQDRVAYVIKVTATILGAMGIPTYSSRRGNRICGYREKVALLVLRQYLGVS